MIIQSKITYKLELNAVKAGKKWARQSYDRFMRKFTYTGIHKLPSGRFCFEYDNGRTSDEWVDSERIDGYGLKMDEKKFCSECSRGMPEEECGDEDDDERVCDECVNETPRPLGTSTPTQHINKEDMNKVLEESLGMDDEESHDERKSDSLDFTEHHISDIREAISHAYNIGMKRAKRLVQINNV